MLGGVCRREACICGLLQNGVGFTVSTAVVFIDDTWRHACVEYPHKNGGERGGWTQRHVVDHQRGKTTVDLELVARHRTREVSGQSVPVKFE